jgi:hypothetical protein
MYHILVYRTRIDDFSKKVKHEIFYLAKFFCDLFSIIKIEVAFSVDKVTDC